MAEFDVKQLERDFRRFKNMILPNVWSAKYEKNFYAIVFHRIISERTMKALEKLEIFDFNGYKERWNTSDQQEIQSFLIEEIHCFLPPHLTFYQLVNDLKMKQEVTESYFSDFYNEIYNVNESKPAQHFFEYIFNHLDFKYDKEDYEKRLRFDMTPEVINHLRDGIIYLADMQFHPNAIVTLQSLEHDFHKVRSTLVPLLRSIVLNHQEVQSIIDLAAGENLFVGYGSKVDYYTLINRDIYKTYTELFLQGVSFEQTHFKQRRFRTEMEPFVAEENRVDAVISHFDERMTWNPEPELLKDKRFSGPGKLVTRQRAEWAYIQNGLSQLADDGIMAIAMSQSPLYRTANEADVRKYLIEHENVIDTIINLPRGTGSHQKYPYCIVIFKKQRKERDILFIDASHYEHLVSSDRVLNDGFIDKVMSDINARANTGEHCYLANYDEIERHKFNLNISRYLQSNAITDVETSNEIQLEDVRSDIDELERKISRNISKLKNLQRNSK